MYIDNILKANDYEASDEVRDTAAVTSSSEGFVWITMKVEQDTAISPLTISQSGINH